MTEWFDRGQYKAKLCACSIFVLKPPKNTTQHIHCYVLTCGSVKVKCAQPSATEGQTVCPFMGSFSDNAACNAFYSHFLFFHVGKENYQHVLSSGNLPSRGEKSPKTVRKWLFLQYRAETEYINIQDHVR